MIIAYWINVALFVVHGFAFYLALRLRLRWYWPVLAAIDAFVFAQSMVSLGAYLWG